MKHRVKAGFLNRLALGVAGLWVAVLISPFASAQTSPVLSGGVGFISTTNSGLTFFQPVIAPVVAVPLGDHVLIESRADLRGLYLPKNGNGPYEGQFFPTLEYLQADFLVNSHLTITAGRFLTPFNTYSERLTPIWIRNFQDAPIIFPIGTRTSGSSDGGMIRGSAAEGHDWQINYTAYFSAESNVDQFIAGRTAGARAGVFIPSARLEIGGSYERFLQDQHIDSYGAYLSWQPAKVPVDVRSEYAQSPRGHGYWIEAAYRFRQPGQGQAWYSGFQPMFRMQQFFRGTPAPGDSLPAANAQQADFGLNYNFPHDVRVSSSYSRNFTVAGNSNIWNVALTYRFLFPLLPGGKH
ncbi:MAG TPA: hypothetical protein VHZ28_11260 [Terracidiphilus sp.]|nr:hypothetical protein [Terracidiphilus sp.]